MRDLAILIFLTLDGVMQSPSSAEEDPSGGFSAGGWAQPYWEAVMPPVFQSCMSAPYDLLLGGKTYDLFAGHWPAMGNGNPVAAVLNSAKKYVMTSRGGGLTWEGAEVLAGDPAEAVRRLKANDGPLIQVHGSWQLIQTLLAADLIDELRLWTFPVVVGTGKRLFGEETPVRGFILQNVQSHKMGLVSTVYRRDRS